MAQAQRTWLPRTRCATRKNRKEVADGIGWSQTLKGLKPRGTEEFCLNTGQWEPWWVLSDIADVEFRDPSVKP